VTYEYDDPKGHVRARAHVSWSVWDEIKRGAPVKVRAARILGLPRSEIVGSGSPMMDGSFFVLVVITIGFNVLMWAVFIATLKPSLRRRAIVMHGTATTGRVTGKSVKRSPQGQIVSRTVCYEYTGPDGATSDTMQITADEYARVHEGDTVHVVFMDGKKAASVIYGFGEYAAADDAGNELVLAAQRV
jgi:hypothetical protein